MDIRFFLFVMYHCSVLVFNLRAIRRVKINNYKFECRVIFTKSILFHVFHMQPSENDTEFTCPLNILMRCVFLLHCIVVLK